MELLYLAANTNLEDHDVVVALSIRSSSLAHSTHSLIISAWAGPNLGRGTVVGVAPGISLNLWGGTPSIGLGKVFVRLANTFSYLNRNPLILSL